MTLLEIIEWPNKILETTSEDVTAFDVELKTLIENMYGTLKESGGIGLAANQVGVTKRVIMIEIPWIDTQAEEEKEEIKPWHNQRYVFINPKITRRQGKIRWQEGCLSFPDIYEFIERSSEVWVEALDAQGESFSVHADGLFAVCLQHEIDHIDGVVFINRMSRLKSGMVKKKIEKKIRLRSEGIDSDDQ